MHSPSSLNDNCLSVLQAWTSSRHSACCWKASGCLVKRRRLPVCWRLSAQSTTNSAPTSSSTRTWCMSSPTPSSCSTPTSTTTRQAAVLQLSVPRCLQADALHCLTSRAGIHVISCIRQANSMVATFLCTRKGLDCYCTPLLQCHQTETSFIYMQTLYPSHDTPWCSLGP